MDWSWLGEAFKILLAGAAGITAKVIYDRRFAKRPDLRYIFGAPAKFAAKFGSERVYQNLEVTNAGTETTTDVRINFSLPNFDLSEYQISYDGPHNFERMNDRVAVVIPTLPPGDSVTLSFVFSPSKSNIDKIQDFFLSVKSKECVAKPLDRTKSTGPDSALNARLALFVQSFFGGLFGLMIFLFLTPWGREVREAISLRDQLTTEKISKIVRLSVQVANPVAPGREVELEFYIENTSDNPFAGFLRMYPPSWADQNLSERINVGAKSRKVVKWKLKVPNDVQPGKYLFTTEVTGDAFDQPVRLRTTEMVEVKL